MVMPEVFQLISVRRKRYNTYQSWMKSLETNNFQSSKLSLINFSAIFLTATLLWATSQMPDRLNPLTEYWTNDEMTDVLPVPGGPCMMVILRMSCWDSIALSAFCWEALSTRVGKNDFSTGIVLRTGTDDHSSGQLRLSSSVLNHMFRIHGLSSNNPRSPWRMRKITADRLASAVVGSSRPMEVIVKTSVPESWILFVELMMPLRPRIPPTTPLDTIDPKAVFAVTWTV